MTDFILGVFEITIGMSLFIALLLLGLKLFGGKFTAKCRYIIWALVMIRLAIPFSFGLLPTFIEIPIDTELVQSEDISSVLSENTDPVTSVQPSDPGDVVVTPTTPSTPVFPNVDTANPGSTPILPVTPTVPGDQAESVIPSDPVIETPTEQPVSLKQILDIAGIVYLTGAAIFLVWSLVSYFIYTRKIMRSAGAADNRTQQIFSTICKKYGMKKQPTLLVASGIHSPAAFGIFRRKIVLPDIAFSENGLVGTLAHEVTHCKRGDLYMKLVELVTCSLNWFNPLVHIAAFKCEMEMELSCDEKVLSGSSEAARAAYADVMLDIIRRCRRNRGALTTHFNPKKSAVTARFKNILYGSGKRRGWILIAVCLVLCVLAGAFVACQIGDDLPDDIDYAEGIYIKDIAGADMVLIDGTSPCTFWGADGVVIEGLTDGDRIRIGVREFLDSSPMQAEVYSIEKLSDGTIDDIDSAVLDSLRELGWIDDTTNQKELPKYLEIPVITLTQIETLPYSEETAVFTASPVGGNPTIFFFDDSRTFYFRKYLSTNMDAEFFTGTLTLPDGFTDAKLLHVTRGAGSGEIFVSIEAIYDGKKEYLTYGFFGTEAPSGVDVLDEVRVQRLMEAMEQMPAMFSITRPSDYTESDVIDVCSDEYGEVIAVTSNVDLSGIEIVEIVRENDFEIAELITLHTVDLVAGEPLLLKVSFPGVTGNRGLIYRDTDGMKKCCEITKSGEDGKILLISSESMAEKVDDTPKHSYTSDIDNFIPPEADSLPKITVLTTGKVLLTYETEEKLPLVYFGQGVDAETMRVTKTEFEAPDFSYTDFEVIDYLYESGYNMYATVRFTLTDGTQNDVLYSGYMGEYTFKEDYEYEYKWRNIRTESANEINRARGQYDPAQQAALIPNQSAQVLFWLRTQSRCYYFCSIRTLNSAANAYTDDPPKDFAIYYQQYDQNFFSVIDEPIPEEYPYDSIVPVLAITGEECISMRCILQLSDGERTYYISYQAYEGIDQAYHPVSDDEVKALANMYPEIFGVIEENIKWTQYTETRTGEDGKNYQISFVLPVEWMHDSGGILNDVNRNKRIGSRYIAVNRSKEDFVSSLEEMAEQYHVDLDSPLTGTSDSGISYMGYCFEGECEIPGDITGRYLYRFAYSDSISLQMDVWKRNAYDDDSFYEQYVLPIVQSVTVREAGGQTDQILNTEELSTYSLIPSGTAGCIVSLTLPSTWKWDGSHFNEANVRIGVYSDQKRVSLYGALPTLQEFEATLRESTGRVYQMDSPITGKTDTGYSFTGYYGDEEMPKGEMSRRYMFYITADQGVYTLEIWQRLDFDGANFLAETVLPIVQSFAIQQTLPHQAILEDRFALYDTLSKKEMLLSDWLKNNEYAVSQYTVIDLDHDADLETVLWLTRGSDANAGFLILHSNAGKTNAHLLYYRQFADLKEDGTFSFSSGVSNHGFGEIRFTGEACSISRIAYCESEDNTTVFYYSERDSRSLTKAEYESWERAQSNKSDPVWYAWNANEEHSAQPIDFSSIGGDWYHSFNYEGWYAFYGLNFRSQTAEMQFDHGLYESEYAHRYSGTYTVDPATQEITAVLHDGRYIHNDPDITIKFTIKVQTEQNNQTLILHILACDVPRYQHLVGQSLAFTREFGYAELEYQAAQNYYQMWYDKELTIDVLLDKSAVKKDIAKEVREATGMDLLVPSLTWEYTADEDRFPLRFFITDNGGKKMVETNIIRYKDEKDGMEKYAVEVNPTVISVE